jgi:chemotaxis protein MotB
MADNAGAKPVVIKRIKKGGHGGHHGGAWKVAYADFVTAMMAFFLLLWLLNAVTQEQLQGISNFFAPISASKTQSAAGAILGGKTISEPGAAESSTAKATVTMDLPPPKAGQGPQDEKSEEAAKEKQKEDEQFKKAEDDLKKAIEGVPAFRQLANSLLVDNTPEGLRIQIVDQDGLAMFPGGSAEMYQHTRRLLEVVGRIIKDLTQNISIAGHTDSTGFADLTKYSNWELSSDRANSARRALMQFGIPPERVSLVVGKAFTEPLVKEDAAHPRNRRLSIVLLRGTGADAAKKDEAGRPAPRSLKSEEKLPGLDRLHEQQIREDRERGLAPAAPAPLPSVVPVVPKAR